MTSQTNDRLSGDLASTATASPVGVDTVDLLPLSPAPADCTQCVVRLGGAPQIAIYLAAQAAWFIGGQQVQPPLT